MFDVKDETATYRLGDGEVPGCLKAFLELGMRYVSGTCRLMYESAFNEPFEVVDGETVYYMYIVGQFDWCKGFWLFEEPADVAILQMEDSASEKGKGQWSLDLMFEFDLSKQVKADIEEAMQDVEMDWLSFIPVPRVKEGALTDEVYELLMMCSALAVAFAEEHVGAIYPTMRTSLETTIEYQGRPVTLRSLGAQSRITKCQQRTDLPKGFDPLWEFDDSEEEKFQALDEINRWVKLFEISPERDAYLRKGYRPQGIPMVLLSAFAYLETMPGWINALDFRSLMTFEVPNGELNWAMDPRQLCEEARAFWLFMKRAFSLDRPGIFYLLNQPDFEFQVYQAFERAGLVEQEKERPRRQRRQRHRC